MVNHGTLVKIMANHDTWNACQDHDKIMEDHGKITMVCCGSYQGYHVKSSIEPNNIFSY